MLANNVVSCGPKTLSRSTVYKFCLAGEHSQSAWQMLGFATVAITLCSWILSNHEYLWCRKRTLIFGYSSFGVANRCLNRHKKLFQVTRSLNGTFDDLEYAWTHTVAPEWLRGTKSTKLWSINTTKKIFYRLASEVYPLSSRNYNAAKLTPLPVVFRIGTYH